MSTARRLADFKTTDDHQRLNEGDNLGTPKILGKRITHAFDVPMDTTLCHGKYWPLPTQQFAQVIQNHGLFGQLGDMAGSEEQRGEGSLRGTRQ